MANEINIQATLTLQKYSPALQGMGDLTITQTGTKCVSNVINVTTGAAASIQIEGTTPIAYLMVKNLDASAWTQNTNYVSIALDSGVTQIFAKLRAGEFCLIPCKENAIYYAKATGTAVDICYVAACA